MSENYIERGRFASETGYTAEEWLAKWRAGEIDQAAPGKAELHERATALVSVEASG